MSETIVLDPSEEADGRFEVDITRFVGQAGPDWGDAQIDAYMADAQLGQIPVDFRVPNRTITIPLNVVDGDGWTFDELRSALQQKVALWQRQGGVIKRQTIVGPVYADVVNASLKLGGSSAQAFGWVDADAVLTLEAIPDWYGQEIDLSAISETSNAELIRVDTPDRGDHPGRVRIVVTDDEGEDQLGLLWAFRSRHYSADATAAPTYEAEDLTAVDAAAIATVSGASGGGSNNVIRHASLGVNWTPVLSTDIDGVGPLTHTGSYRVYARCYSTSTVPPRVRMTWDVGDLVNPTTNAPALIPGTSQFYLLDLGEVRLDPAPVGTHQWSAQIQAAGAAGGENVSIDKLWLFALDDSAGKLAAAGISPDAGFDTLIARDDFSQTSGNLHGKTADVGGTWSTSGSGSDFSVDSSIHAVTRSGTDGSQRIALLGSTITGNIAVRVDVKCDAVGNAPSIFPQLLARYTDTNNGAFVTLTPSANQLAVFVTVGGTPTTYTTTLPFSMVSGGWVTVQVVVLTNGQFFVWAVPQGANLVSAAIAATNSALATGGALDDGKIGLADTAPSSSVNGRTFDNLAAWAPGLDAVIHSDRALEIRTDGAYRATADGAGQGPVAFPGGDLPRLPSPGLEGLPVELMVKASRGDLASLPDGGIDDVTVQVFYRPSYLYIPDGGPGS